MATYKKVANTTQNVSQNLTKFKALVKAWNLCNHFWVKVGEGSDYKRHNIYLLIKMPPAAGHDCRVRSFLLGCCGTAHRCSADGEDGGENVGQGGSFGQLLMPRQRLCTHITSIYCHDFCCRSTSRSPETRRVGKIVPGIQCCM